MLAIKIKKIKLSELLDFIHSVEYKKMIVKPISEVRAISYTKNPRAKLNTNAVYLAFLEDELVGFRSIFQDKIFILNKAFDFAWLSGSWVKKEFRRRGIASFLFNEVFKDWKGHLAYLNHIKSSSTILYDKSEKFCTLFTKDGLRIYFKPAIYNLFSKRLPILKKIKFFVRFIEVFISICTAPYRYLAKYLWKNKLKEISISEVLNDEIKEFIDNNPASCFMRKSDEYKWIFDYGWIQKKAETICYPFSYKYKLLKINFLTTKDALGKINGLAIIKNYDGKVSVPYFFTTKSAKILTYGIVQWVLSNAVNYATFFHPLLVNELHKIHFIALWRKQRKEVIAISKIICEQFPKPLPTMSFQDGDGDCVFT